MFVKKKIQEKRANPKTSVNIVLYLMLTDYKSRKLFLKSNGWLTEWLGGLEIRLGLRCQKQSPKPHCKIELMRKLLPLKPSFSPAAPSQSSIPLPSPVHTMESCAQDCLHTLLTSGMSSLTVHLVGGAQVICLHPSCKGGWKFEFRLQCWEEVVIM